MLSVAINLTFADWLEASPLLRPSARLGGALISAPSAIQLMADNRNTMKAINFHDRRRRPKSGRH